MKLHRPKHLLHYVKPSLHTWGDETGEKKTGISLFLVSEKIFKLMWVHIYSPKVYSDYYLSAAAAGVNISYGLVDVIGRLEGD